MQSKCLSSWIFAPKNWSWWEQALIHLLKLADATCGTWTPYREHSVTVKHHQSSLKAFHPPSVSWDFPCCYSEYEWNPPAALPLGLATVQSVWVSGQFMTFSMQWATATNTYCQTITLNLTSKCIFRVKYLDFWMMKSFTSWKHSRSFLFMHPVLCPSDDGPESQKSLILVASWFKDAPMGAWAEGVYSIGISRNSCFTSN